MAAGRLRNRPQLDLGFQRAATATKLPPAMARGESHMMALISEQPCKVKRHKICKYGMDFVNEHIEDDEVRCQSPRIVKAAIWI